MALTPEEDHFFRILLASIQPLWAYKQEMSFASMEREMDEFFDGLHWKAKFVVNEFE
jgi:hypothetical protein